MAVNKHPLFTLREMEERARERMESPAPVTQSKRWVGLLVRIGEQKLLIATNEVREVFSYRRNPKPSVVPGAKVWLKGLASLRGELLSIVDLGEYLQRLPCQLGLSARVIVTKHQHIRAGLLVDEVCGLRQFAANEQQKASENETWATGAFALGDEVYPVLSIESLGSNPEFCNAAYG